MNEIPDMTLRDWFAGMAIQGLLAGDLLRWKKGIKVFDENNLNVFVAELSYTLADSLIIQREKYERINNARLNPR